MPRTRFHLATRVARRRAKEVRKAVHAILSDAGELEHDGRRWSFTAADDPEHPTIPAWLLMLCRDIVDIERES